MDFQWNLIKRQITLASFVYLSQVLKNIRHCKNCCQTLKNNLTSLVDLFEKLDESQLQEQLSNIPDNLRNTLIYFNLAGLLVMLEKNQGYLSVGNSLDILRTLQVLSCFFSKTTWYVSLEQLLKESVEYHKMIKVE
jgi:hypothetical protein